MEVDTYTPVLWNLEQGWEVQDQPGLQSKPLPQNEKETTS